MSTDIRAELSHKNKYYINKHRYYELKHFCLQYLDWKERYKDLEDGEYPSAIFSYEKTTNKPDPTCKVAERMYNLDKYMKLVENAADEADSFLAKYIIMCVTQGCSYNYLRYKLDMPCGKDMFYDRYRKFFWLLDKKKA